MRVSKALLTSFFLVGSFLVVICYAVKKKIL